MYRRRLSLLVTGVLALSACGSGNSSLDIGLRAVGSTRQLRR